jgi:hypothetical protein
MELYVFRLGRRVEADGDGDEAEADRATPDRIVHDCSNGWTGGVVAMLNNQW